MGIEKGKFLNKGPKCNIQQEDFVVFEKAFGRYYFIKSTLGYARLAGANQAIVWEPTRVDSDDAYIWRFAVMSDGGVQLLSKAPGNNTLRVKNRVFWSEKFDDEIKKEKWFLRKDCNPKNANINRDGSTTIYSEDNIAETFE